MKAERMSLEEFLNSLTHGLGAVAGAVGGAVLVGLALRSGDPWQVVGVAVFGFALVLLYSVSAIYHAARHERRKERLRMLDHCAIYVLIAGTYTPFAIGSFRGPLGWALLLVIWALAVAGILYKLFFLGRFPRFSTLTYLAMAWIALPTLPWLLNLASTVTLVWLLVGGVAYTSGTLVYHSRRRFAHPVWHGFVLTGSACHFVAVLTLVLAPAI
jgi:hemolysin III